MIASVTNIFDPRVIAQNFTGFLECHLHDFTDSIVHVARQVFKEAQGINNFSKRDYQVIAYLRKESQELIDAFPGYTHCAAIISDSSDPLPESMCQWKTPYDNEINKRSINDGHCFEIGYLDSLKDWGKDLCTFNWGEEKDVKVEQRSSFSISFDTLTYIKVAIPLLACPFILIAIYKCKSRTIKQKENNSL